MPAFFRLAFMALLLLQFGCAAQKSYRPIEDDLLSTSDSCHHLYNSADQSAIEAVQATPKYATPEWNRMKLAHPEDRCWNASWEHHDDYELLFTEFDDAGWQYGDGKKYGTQIDYVMHRLNDFLDGEGKAGAQPLNIIVFTHGWHHTADASDTNVRQFRYILGQAAIIEEKLCHSLGKECDGENAGGGAGAKNASHAPPWKRKRKVVGIYVGWRGDSISGPLIEMSSIWDRKLAAETVSLGAVQEFYANLHNFYVSHSCHKRPGNRSDAGNAPSSQCADVRMLVMGHSFGGLIT